MNAEPLDLRAADPLADAVGRPLRAAPATPTADAAGRPTSAPDDAVGAADAADRPAAADGEAPAPRAGLRAGPLVAVCGLAGGAGTTLLSWLLARDALDDGAAPVLLAELPGSGGGLAALTGGRDGPTLAQLATGPPGTPWPAAPGGPRGLHLAAAAPAAPADDVAAPALARALAQARAEHARVVVDCGRLHAADARAALAVATHVVWTVPAGPAAGELARTLLLDSDVAPPPGGAVELLVTVATRPATLAARGQRALREVVAARGERLVVVPHVRALAGAGTGATRAAPRRLSAAVAAIAGVLARSHPS